MNHIHVDRVDLNLLRVLCYVQLEGGVTRAAERLNITQSAVSHALRRLRASLNDPLFIRRENGLVATPLAQELCALTQGALRTLGGVIGEDRAFDPATSSRCFTIGIDERLEVFLLPALIQRTISAAPHVEFRTMSVNVDELEASFANGQVDAVVGSYPFKSAHIHRTPVAGDALVVMARRDHPRIRHGAMTRKDYLAADHILVTNHSSVAKEEDALLAFCGLTRRIRVRTQRYVAAMEIAACSDMILTLPGMYAHVINQATRNALVPLPARVPALQYFLHWHHGFEADPGGVWLRQQIGQAFQMAPGMASGTARY